MFVSLLTLSPAVTHISSAVTHFSSVCQHVLLDTSTDHMSKKFSNDSIVLRLFIKPSNILSSLLKTQK